MSSKVKRLCVLAVAATMLATYGCSKPSKPADENTAKVEDKKTEDTKAEDTKAEDKKDVAAPGEDAGFDEFPIGDEQESGPLAVAGVYFQPVDMEPAGNSLSKEEADCHIEADISATDEGAKLGYGAGDFVPWLNVKAYIQKKGSDKVQEIAFMPMNASDGPHYGANMKFEEGLGTYNVKFEISAPGNDYLLHVDKETGVTGRFWTEPIVIEWPEFEWTGPKW
ncbi:hypothetical protein C7381_10576 [Ezakiella coagulans]|uniref:Fe2+ transport protein n=1 Tax=Ezakiella coagulans TaxID=46507 RepID=A0A2U1E348_9FIRM|nr:iron transporter [Ezakiella coagulans]PVY94373.1 hypothetical protein C7381_10576 [Ezakiella coagulans]UQK60045.1 iron transporter [Ezakiella coagulans]